MAQSVISIKFDGYDKTFANINGIAEELSLMNEEILKAEKELANADFGSDEWNSLSESIQENTSLIKGFTKEIEKSSDVSLDSIQKVIKANDEYTKSLEETQKVFDEEFSSAKITEFGAKAAAALLGVAESVAILGDSSKSAEQLQKQFQQTVIVTNALKDSAEVLGDAQKKLSALTNTVTASFKNGATFAQKFSKTMEVLGKASRGPLLVFTLITGAVAGLIATFGPLQGIIDGLTDTFAGFVNVIKGLASGKLNIFDQFKSGKEASAIIRDANKELDRLASKISGASVEWAKYQAAADKALTVEDRRTNINKIAEERVGFLKDEVAQLDILASATTDIVGKRELWAKADSKLIEIQQILTENILANKDLTLQSIDNEVQALQIRNSRVIDGLQKQLEAESLNLDQRLDIIDKIGKAEKASIDRQILLLSTKVKLNEAEINTLNDLKNQSKRVSDSIIANKKAEITATSQFLRQRIALENQLEIERSEKSLEFIDIRNQAGLDYYTAEVNRIKDLRLKEIDAELAQFAELEKFGELTREQSLRRKELIIERVNTEITASETIKDAQIANIAAVYEYEAYQIEINNQLRAQLLEQQTIEAGQYIKLLDIQTERIKKQSESFGSIFKIGKIREQTEKNINDKYQKQFELLQKNKDEQLKLIEGSIKLKKDKEQQLLDQAKIRDLTKEEKAELEKISAEIEKLKGDETTVKIKFQADIQDNEIANADELKASFGEIIEGVASEVGKTAELAQTVVSIGGDIIGLQIEALDAELDKIEDKRKSIEDKLAILNKQLADTQQEIANINTLIEDSEGSRRAFLQEGLEKETAQRDEINKRIQAEEAAKLSLAQQEEAINAKKEAAQKRADALERISTAIAATATAIQAGLAVAKAAGQSGVAAPITVPLVVGAVAAGLGAILSIVSATRKFKDGGELDGPSHDEGGIKGTGSFGNIEVEGGEYIVNKQATRNNKDLLRKINMEGRWKKFENGGELKPNINQVNNLITSNSVTGGLSEIANQKVYLSLVEFKQANKKFTSIEEDNRI